MKGKRATNNSCIEVLLRDERHNCICFVMGKAWFYW